MSANDATGIFSYEEGKELMNENRKKAEEINSLKRELRTKEFDLSNALEETNDAISPFHTNNADSSKRFKKGHGITKFDGVNEDRMQAEILAAKETAIAKKMKQLQQGKHQLELDTQQRQQEIDRGKLQNLKIFFGLNYLLQSLYRQHYERNSKNSVRQRPTDVYEESEGSAICRRSTLETNDFRKLEYAETPRINYWGHILRGFVLRKAGSSAPACFLVSWVIFGIATFQLCWDCRKERTLWFQANGLTRAYLLRIAPIEDVDF